MTRPASSRSACPAPSSADLREPAVAAASAAAAEALGRDLFRERPRPSSTIQVVADDGVTLAADLYLPPGAAHAKLLLGPAMGVSRRFYASFLGELARHGIASMVADYRGIGGSRTRPLRAETARLSDWGERDLAAATRALTGLDVEGVGRAAPTLFVGHSVGGQLFGLLQDAPYRAALLIGSQAGYWRHWTGPSRVAMAALWFGAIPLFTRTLGYLPMRAFGQGEDIPGGVAREWARWGRDRRYAGVRAAEIDEPGYTHWRGALRAVSITDDGYAPEAAVRALAGAYDRADVEVVRVRPRDVGARRIGHFGWFHPRHRHTSWAEARAWLTAAAARQSAGETSMVA